MERERTIEGEGGHDAFQYQGAGIDFRVIWGGALLCVGLANLLWAGYGQAFLNLMASVYPVYEAGASIGQVMLATIYGLVDGAIAGLIFGWLYNRLATGGRAETR